MRTDYSAGYTGHISSSEWRWVLLISSVLTLLAILPYVWVVVTTQSDEQFMGALHDFERSSGHLARIVQGSAGEWLSLFNHTPEPHNGVLVDMVYILIGQIARITSLPSIALYHIGRVGASLFMYSAIYTLGAVIWMRVRTRRVFFLLAVLGGGFGWLVSPLTQDTRIPDVTLSTLYPFHVTLANVHLPLAIAALCFLVGAVIAALKPGSTANPSVTNSGGLLFIFSLLLAVLYPLMLFPVGAAFISLLLIRAINSRGVSAREIRWIAWFSIPALPLMVYYLTLFALNPVAAQLWPRQIFDTVPPPLLLVIGLGLPLIIAVPGIVRAVRRFEPDGNQLMLIWLVAMLAFAYLIPTAGLNIAAALMIPLAYFGARAFEDFWSSFVRRRWRYRVFVLLLPVMAVSHAYVLYTPVALVNRGDAVRAELLLDRDYAFAFQWLDGRSSSPNIVLTAPSVGVWLPAWVNGRVVYGYADATLDPITKRTAVQEWYAVETASEDVCLPLLDGAQSAGQSYSVRYVIYGPEERELGESACLDLLTPVVRLGEVTIYGYRPILADTTP